MQKGSVKVKWIVEIDIENDISFDIQNFLENMIESMNEGGELDNYYPSVNVERIK